LFRSRLLKADLLGHVVLCSPALIGGVSAQTVFALVHGFRQSWQICDWRKITSVVQGFGVSYLRLFWPGLVAMLALSACSCRNGLCSLLDNLCGGLSWPNLHGLAHNHAVGLHALDPDECLLCPQLSRFVLALTDSTHTELTC